MNNPKYINNIDLEYLANPTFQKYNNEYNENLDEDLLFYSKRIIQITKDLCKKKIENKELNSCFKEYITTIIYHLKREDEQELYQKYYDNLISKPNASEKLDEAISNDIIFKKNTNKNNNLNNFVITKSLSNEDKIMPLQRNVNIKEDRFRTKGVKIKK